MIDPNETDVEEIYDDPSADTVIVYTTDGDQEVYTKEDWYGGE